MRFLHKACFLTCKRGARKINTTIFKLFLTLILFAILETPHWNALVLKDHLLLFLICDQPGIWLLLQWLAYIKIIKFWNKFLVLSSISTPKCARVFGGKPILFVQTRDLWLKMLSDEQILNLYKDTDFPGSWSGARTFQMFLKLNKNEYVTLDRIYKILKQIPQYYISGKIKNIWKPKRKP